MPLCEGLLSPEISPLRAPLFASMCRNQKLLLPSGLEPVPIEFRVRRVIIEQCREAY